MSRHNVWIPDRLWEQAQETARRQSLREGQDVSVSELIRRGLASVIRQAEDQSNGTSSSGTTN